jgi:hypothetical protein
MDGHEDAPRDQGYGLNIGRCKACLSTVLTRLLTLSTSLFTDSDDWTFDSTPTALIFIIEILLSVMNLLAPSLPVFFDQTSTGGSVLCAREHAVDDAFTSSGPSQKFGSVVMNVRLL